MLSLPVSNKIHQPARVKWKFCALVSVAMIVLSLIPQIHLWIARGREWNGAYVIIQGDEPLYSAYINALMSGRTRKNDPFAATDDNPSAPLPESTFSIQFIPPYIIAFLARTFDVTASTAMILLIVVAALLSSLSVFWLLDLISDDFGLATAGTFFVLCLGGLAGGHALIGLLVKTGDLSIPSLPFLRRYQPAATLPILIAFIGFVWKAILSESKRGARVWAGLAGLAFAVLVFSYLYLWTAAAALLACLGVVWFWLRPHERRRLIAVYIIIGAIGTVAMIPYLYLVSHRPPTLDEQQTLAFTHRPDFLRIPEILGVLVLTALFAGIQRQRIERNAPRTLLAAALALLPIVVFNQQIFSGRSMQPYHFAALVVNYTTLIGIFLTLTLWWNPISHRTLVWIAAICFAWGLVEVGLPSRLNTVPNAMMEDQIVPVLLRLKQLTNEDGTVSDLRTKGAASTIVFSPQIMVTALTPTWTSQGTLPDAGGIDFGHITRDERKRNFYMHLYYAKANIESLREALRGNPIDPMMKYYARAVIFGHERIVPALSGEFKPITEAEIENEIRAYEAYAESFSRVEALKRPITYAVIPSEGNFDFANIDRWYERDSGERFGKYVLYRVKLKD